MSPPARPRATPPEEQLGRALEVIRIGIQSGMLPSLAGDSPGQHTPVHPIGPGALATGHGLAGGGRKPEGTQQAYQAFVEAVRRLVGEPTWGRLSVLDQASWVQLRGERGRIYVAKTRGVVSRIESTLSPEEVPVIPEPPEGGVNASEPDRPNGNIRSWLRADAGVVAGAVRVIAGPCPGD